MANDSFIGKPFGLQMQQKSWKGDECNNPWKGDEQSAPVSVVGVTHPNVCILWVVPPPSFCDILLFYYLIYLRSTPHPVTVTTRIITFLVGNPYKPSFATVTGWGVDPRFTILTIIVWYVSTYVDILHGGRRAALRGTAEKGDCYWEGGQPNVHYLYSLYTKVSLS